MTIHLDGFAWAQALVGVPFPRADEDALRRCAQAWRAAADQLRRLPPEAAAVGADVRLALDGAAGARFAQEWHPVTQSDGPFGQLADACLAIAAACDHVAMEVEYAKLAFLIALGVLAATLAALAVAMAGSAGTAGIGVPVAIATARLTIRAVLARLLVAVLLGAGTNAAMDLTVQISQMMLGTRDGWDAAKTASAACDGAIYGGLTGAALLGGAAFAPGVFASGWGIIGGLGLGGVLGTAFVGLVHGGRPDVTELFLGLTSGVVGGLGPGLIAGRSPSGTGGWLPALDGGALPSGDSGTHPVLAGWGGIPGRGVVDGLGDPTRPSTASSTVEGRVGDAAASGPFPTTSVWTPSPATPSPAALSSTPVTGQSHPPQGTPLPPAAGGPPITGTPSPPITGTPPSLPPTPSAPPSLPPTPSAPPSLPPTPSGPPAQPGGSAAAQPALTSPGTPSALAASPSASTLPGGGAAIAGPLSTVVTAPPLAFAPSSAGGAPPRPSSSAPSPAVSTDRGPDEAGVSNQPAPRALTDAEAMTRTRECLFRTGAGYGFYLAGDENRAFATAIRPTPGFVTIDVHGSLRDFTVDDGRLTPEQFAAALRELISTGEVAIGPGEGIRLIACDTAEGGDASPAAILADQLGLEVLAPDRVVWTAIDGEEIVAAPRLVAGVLLPVDPPDGTWHRFTPDKARAHAPQQR